MRIQKPRNKPRFLIDIRRKDVAIILIYIKFGLKVWSTNISNQKIDESIFKRFGIVLTSFQVENKLEGLFFSKRLVIYTNRKEKTYLENLLSS